MSFDDAWHRIQQTVRESEKHLRSGDNDPAARQPPGTWRLHVKIVDAKVAMTTTTSTTGTETTTTTTTTSSSTSSTSTTPGATVYCYPAVVLVRDLRYIGTSDEWYESPQLVWAQELNDQDLVVGKRYVGEAVQYYDGRALVIVEVGSGGSSEVVTAHFVGPFVQDDPGMPTPSPWCYYPAYIVVRITPLAKIDGEAIWVMFEYNLGHIPGTGGNPATTIRVDGSARHTCRYAGFSYNPSPAGGSAGERRVFYCTEAAWGWRGGCGPDDDGDQDIEVDTAG